MKTGAFHYLRAVGVGDQRFPCSFVGHEAKCGTRARFVILPSCVETEETWPRAQSCPAHLARVIKEASARCTGHMGGKVVRVRPM